MQDMHFDFSFSGLISGRDHKSLALSRSITGGFMRRIIGIAKGLNYKGKKIQMLLDKGLPSRIIVTISCRRQCYNCKEHLI